MVAAWVARVVLYVAALPGVASGVFVQ